MRSKRSEALSAMIEEIGTSQRWTPATALVAERHAGLRFVITTRGDSTRMQVGKRIPVVAGVAARITPLFDTPTLQAAGNDNDDVFLLTFGDTCARDLRLNVYDLAHELRDGSGGLFAQVEPDLPSGFPERGEPGLAAGAGGDWCSVGGNAPKDKYWHLKQIKAPGAWKTTKGKGIRIGHLDTGYTNHPELEYSLDVRSGYDYIDGDHDAYDPRDYGGWLNNPGHGTRTGGVIASRYSGPPLRRTVADADLAGVAPEATLVPIRCIRSVVVLYPSDVARGVRRATDVGCHIISMSLGGLAWGFLEREIERAVKHNLIVCAAAGNCVPYVVAPASFDDCIAVAGCNEKKKPWKYSSHGKKVAVSAPAELVWTPSFCGDRPIDAPGEGTSYAVACVAGAAALWRATHGEKALLANYGRIPLQYVFDLLLRATAQSGHLDPKEYGAGILDVDSLVNADLPAPDKVKRSRAGIALGRDPLESILSDPAVLPRQVTRLLGSLFDTSPPTAERALLRLELAHILARDRNARAAFLRSAALEKTSKLAAPDVEALANLASKRLSRALGVGS